MPHIPATCELWIDGARYADGRAGQDPADPAALSGLTVSWGRQNTIDQPEPATCTFTILDPPGGSVRFDDTVVLGSAVVVWADLDGRRTVVFGGRVTDLTADWDPAAGGAVLRVIAADLLSDLSNRFVGAEPWAMQTAGARAARILAAVSVPTTGLTVAPRPAAVQVSRLDVDRQPAGQLLADLATTTGAVLWCAYDPALAAPYLLFEDPSTRASLYVFTENTATLKWAPAPGSGAGTALTACNVLQDPVQWLRAVTDLITRVTVTWKDQATSPGTTDRTVALVSAGAETTYGARGLSIGTDLTSSADATALATGQLAAHQPSPAWRTEGLTWDLARTEADQAAADLAFALLGNVTRVGYAIALTDLPEWTPTGAATQLYIEGGDYTYATDPAGTPRWVLALRGVPSTGLGGSMTYGQTDRSVRYVDVDRSVTFTAMIGVGPAGDTGTRWEQLTGTWTAQTQKWKDY